MFSDANEGIAADHRVFFGASRPEGVEEGDIERKQLGAMLYGEQCANSLFADKVWGDAKPLRVDMPPADVNGAEGREARFEVIDFSNRPPPPAFGHHLVAGPLRCA